MKLIYADKTNEELVTMISDGNEDAYDQLFLNLRPIIMKEASIYIGKMTTYDKEDLIQEAEIQAWKIIANNNFKSGKFATYFTKAVRYHFITLYRNYCSKNAITVSEIVDECGLGFNVCVLVEPAYAETYREKHRRECRAYYAKKKAQEAEARRAAGIPDPEPKPHLTPEEKRAKRNARQLAYYHAHKEELNARRKAKREMKKV